jgi:hypothetical protein
LGKEEIPMRYSLLISIFVVFVFLLNPGLVDSAYSAPNDVGSPPVITSPEENEWFACDAPVEYCWELPVAVSSVSVSGYEVQFSNTQTSDGPWDAVRYFTSTCWHYAAGHQCVWEALYWRARIVYDNGARSPWAISYHRVGALNAPTEYNSWGKIKNIY